MVFKPGSTEVLEGELTDFLSKNDISYNDISIFINGVSGDMDNDKLLSELATKRFQHIPEIRFKHLCGEYCTASSFGLWMGASILKKQEIPSGVQFNKASVPSFVKTALLVNQYMGKNYSFILLAGC